MMVVHKAGMLDTLQDGGWAGMAHWGISRGGCMDAVAATLANALVGNAPGVALLEMHHPAPVLQFTKACTIALCGAHFSPRLQGIPAGMWRPIQVAAGSRLDFGKHTWGQRCYLALQGGWQVPAVLGSCSTHLAGGFGGWQGRALRSGDALPYAPQETPAISTNQVARWYLPHAALYSGHLAPTATRLTPPQQKVLPIRVLPGPEVHCLLQGLAALEQAGAFIISTESNRMGYRLQGLPLEALPAPPMLSSPVLPGTLQLLPDGQLIVLMADAQTTGGYPRVGQVMAADMHLLAQAGAGRPIRLLPVTAQVAVAARAQQQALLLKLQHNIVCMRHSL